MNNISKIKQESTQKKIFEKYRKKEDDLPDAIPDTIYDLCDSGCDSGSSIIQAIPHIGSLFLNSGCI